MTISFSLKFFFSDMFFSNLEIIRLETNDSSLLNFDNQAVGPRLEMRYDGKHYFVLDQNQKSLFRFQKNGTFLNKIGRSGDGPAEYAETKDFVIDPETNIVDILSSNGKIVSYTYDGKYLSTQNYDLPINSFVKIDNNYWFSLSTFVVGEKRLCQVSEDGTILGEFLPKKNNWMSFGSEQNLYKSSNTISYKEMFSHETYKIVNGDLRPGVSIDLGKYSIPAEAYSFDQMEGINFLNNKGWATIDKYMENEDFIYLFFLLWPNEDANDAYCWLINKKTQNSVLHYFSHDDPIYKMMGVAKVLTPNNELLFIVDPIMFEQCSDSFFCVDDKLNDSFAFDSNPLVIKMLINYF